jgi:hypothetical protein
MKKIAHTVNCPKPEWVKRFGYLAMLCWNRLDTQSAMVIAESQFDAFCHMEPEAAAELYSGEPGRTVVAPVCADRRRAPERRRVFGAGAIQAVPNHPLGDGAAVASSMNAAAG